MNQPRYTMRPPMIRIQALAILVAACGFSSGCKKEPAPPAPVSAEEAPATLQQVFEQKPGDSKKPQDPEVRRLVDVASEALRNRDYSRAMFTLETLSGRSDLTGDQRDYVTRAMLTARQMLEQVAAGGNQQARDALEFRRRTK